MLKKAVIFYLLFRCLHEKRTMPGRHATYLTEMLLFEEGDAAWSTWSDVGDVGALKHALEEIHIVK